MGLLPCCAAVNELYEGAVENVKFFSSETAFQTSELLLTFQVTPASASQVPRKSQFLLTLEL